MLVIENGTVYTPSQVIPDGVVLVEGRQIVAVGRRGELAIPEHAPRVDAGGGSIAPGFVDMHMHGLHNHDIMDGRVDSLRQMSSLLPRYGVASFVPTTVSAPAASIERALQTGRDAMQSGLHGAQMLGVHVEGPFLSAQERGAHRLDQLRAPQPEDRALLLRYVDVLRSCTLAPELPGALDLIRALSEHGVVVSVGHSSAIDAEMERAVDAGLSHATHLYGNMSTLKRVNMRRVAGVVESVLLDDRLSAEIIGDGYHIAPSLIKLALKAKGAEHLAVVTDASPLTGLPPGPYRVWEIDVILEEEIAFVADRTAYAGSVATMDRCLRRVMELAGLSLSDGLRMVGLTPATILGVADRKGSLAAGKDADIVILDQNRQVVQTLVAGQTVFERGRP